MLRAIGLPLLCLAMFSIAGGHWAVLQTVAWAQMVATYSQEVSLAEAVEKTFSGEAPCSMCKSIAEGRQKEEQTPATVKLDKKAEVFVVTVNEFLKRPVARDFSYRQVPVADLAARSDAPPVPVPIFHS